MCDETRAIYQVAEKFSVDPVELQRRWSWMQLWLTAAWMEDVDAEVDAIMSRAERERDRGGRGAGRREQVVRWSEMDRVMGLSSRAYPKQKARGN